MLQFLHLQSRKVEPFDHVAIFQKFGACLKARLSLASGTSGAEGHVRHSGNAAKNHAPSRPGRARIRLIKAAT